MNMRQMSAVVATLITGSMAVAAPWNVNAKFDQGSTSYETTSAEANAPVLAPVQIKGFGDIQYRMLQEENTNKSGFQVADAALYFSHTSGSTSFNLDLPFAWSSSTPSHYDPNTADNNFSFGVLKAQAYVTYTHGNTKVQLGQFDTIFGFELNDSPEIIFSRQGLIYGAMLPVTHTGLMVSHTLAGVTGRLMIADSPNHGSLDGGQTAYAAQLAWANEMFRAAAGYQTFNAYSGEADTFADALLGMTWAGFTLDLEGTWNRIPSMDTTTNIITSRKGTGYLIVPTYAITEFVSVAARYEMLKDGTFEGTAFNDATSITAGLQFQLTSALRAKVDYTAMEFKKTDGTETKPKATVLSAVYKF